MFLIINESIYSELTEVDNPELLNNLKFDHESLNYRSGQQDMLLTASLNGDVIGYVDYAIYENKIYINMIKVSDEYKRQGVGKQLHIELAKQYGYDNIQRGHMTPEGFSLRKKIDKHFNWKQKEPISNQITKNIFKMIKKKTNVDVYNFMLDYYNDGNVVWQNKEKYNYKDFLIDGNDPNELSDIVRYIDGAKENVNRSTDEVPEYITSDLKKLLQGKKI